MNLLLLVPEEAADRVTLRDARARHVREVLRAEIGDSLRVGVLDGPFGEGRVVSLDPLVLDCAFEAVTPEPSEDTLLLAVPRPKVLQRCLAHAAALGFGRIALFRSWRVEKAHLLSRLVDPEVARPHLLSGLSQARRTRLPRVEVFPLFKPFVEDRLDAFAPRGPRLVAHPAAATPTATLEIDAAPFTLAIGPEGGFLPYEVECLQAIDFRAVHAGTHPLRVEAALNYVTGQLHLLRSRAEL